MVNYNYAANSFANTWQECDYGDFPSGVILDISVVTPFESPVHITKLESNGREVCLELSQSDKLIAWGAISDCAFPEALDCVEGVVVSVLLGYIPSDVKFYGICEISPQRITKVSSTDRDSNTLTLQQGAVVETIELEHNIQLLLGSGLSATVDRYGDVQLSLSSELIQGGAEIQNTVTTVSNILTKINGATAATDTDIVDVTIQFNDVPLPVSKISDSVAVLDTTIIPACSGEDVIDSHIGPDTPHDGYQLILDGAYTATGERDTELLESRKYGYNNTLNLIEVDPKFDSVGGEQ